VGRFHEPNAGSLRLVGDAAGVAAPSRRASDSADHARRRVARENAEAAHLDLEDARLVFALRVSERLEGGRAAILTPESRERLLRLSSRMGLAPFDASLVIAIVQDAARRGEHAEDPATTGRLRLVRGRAGERAVESLMIPAASAIVLAIALFTLLATWALRA